MGTMILAHWFKKRLGSAFACIFGGASIGGCIFPVTVRALLHRTRYVVYSTSAFNIMDLMLVFAKASPGQ